MFFYVLGGDPGESGVEPDHRHSTKSARTPTDASTVWGKISHERALQEGRDLKDVLQEFMGDVKEACRQGGRVVAHQLEFDAGVIYEELGRCGLDNLRDEWASIARKGFCTMTPLVGRWLREASGEDLGQPTTQHVLGLQDTLSRLLPDVTRKLRHHVAEDDAEMTRLIYLALLRRAAPAAGRAGGLASA